MIFLYYVLEWECFQLFFTVEYLVTILKKPNIDLSIAKHYRPVVISTVFSKLEEMAILDEHDFSFLY